MKVYVSVKKISSRKTSVDAVEYELKSNPKTVADLINEFVEICVEQYKNRSEAKDMLHFLSGKEIQGRAESGKIWFDNNSGQSKIVLDESKRIAREGFEDGLVSIFIDGVEQKNINDSGINDANQKIDLHENSKIVFIKLSFLAGRLW